jgi:hypothetical protein
VSAWNLRGLAPGLLAIFTIWGGAACVESPAGGRVDLRGDDWKIRFEDSARFRNVGYDDRRWSMIRVPSNWALIKSYPGVSWYRKRVTLPPDFARNSDRGAALYIETILDSDETYWNGVPIGGMGQVDDFRSHAYGRPRVYHIPSDLMRPGENLLAVRVRGFFAGDAGIRSGEIYLDDALAIEARIVLAEQLQLLIAFAFLALAVGFFASCVYARSWQIRGWFATGSWAAGWIQIWTTPLAYDWLERFDPAAWSGFQMLLVPSEPFAFVKMMDYGGHYLLGIAGVAFWTAYLRLRQTPLHVIYYSFSLLMYSGCVISDDLLLWNSLFDYWFAVTAPTMLWIVAMLIRRSRTGETRWRWMLFAFSVMAAVAVHDWFFHNGFAIASYSAPLLRFGLLAHQFLVAIQLVRDFRRENERSDGEFQRLWSLRLKNQHFLQALLARLREPTKEIQSICADLARPAENDPSTKRLDYLSRLSRESLSALADLESDSNPPERGGRLNPSPGPEGS